MPANHGKSVLITKRRILCTLAGLSLGLALILGVLLYLLLARVEGRYFDSNGVSIHYTDEGEGEPVLLIHGLAANADLNWRRSGIVRMLSRDFRVITFDLRGHGLSGQPTDPKLYGIEVVEDAVRLMDHLEVESAHVAGYSLGGFLALKLLEDHPGRVRCAALCAAGWKDPEDESEIPSPYRPPEIEALRPVKTAGLFKSLRNWGGRQVVNRTAVKAMRKTFTALAVKKTTLEENTVPAMCVIGTQDGLLPLARDLKAHMKNLEYTEIPGAGHMGLLFKAEFRRLLREFLAAHKGVAAPVH